MKCIKNQIYDRKLFDQYSFFSTKIKTKLFKLAIKELIKCGDETIPERYTQFPISMIDTNFGKSESYFNNYIEKNIFKYNQKMSAFYIIFLKSSYRKIGKYVASTYNFLEDYNWQNFLLEYLTNITKQLICAKIFRKSADAKNFNKFWYTCKRGNKLIKKYLILLFLLNEKSRMESSFNRKISIDRRYHFPFKI